MYLLINRFNGSAYNLIAFEKIYDHSFKGVLEVDFRLLQYLFKHSEGAFNTRIRFLKETEKNWALDFPPVHRFMQPFNKKIQQLFTAGIPNFHKKIDWIYSNPKRYARFQHLDKPQTLTMEHLSAGFIIWILCVSLGPLGFLLEWMTKVREYLIAKYIFVALFEVKYAE